jgi:methylglutaconyl-CoA hydratase
MSDLIRFSVNDKGTATVSLHRPGKKDALNHEMVQVLTDIFRDIARRNDVKRVILDSGPDHAFCAGIDVNDLAAAMREDLPYEERLRRNEEASEEFARMFDAIACCGKPIIGIVKGIAIGAGATLVALCDHVVASDDAVFRYPEIEMGLKPSISAPYVVARIGPENAIRHFSSGAPFSAEEARRMHMVDEICPSADIKAAQKRVQAAAENGELSFPPKPLPPQIPSAAPDAGMEALVKGAQMLYENRTEAGRAGLITETAHNFATDRVNPARAALLERYRARVVKGPAGPSERGA